MACGMTTKASLFSIHSVKFDSFEALRSPLADSRVELVQLSRHPVRGSLLKASLGDIAFSHGQFTGSCRGSGLLSSTRYSMGLVLDRVGEMIRFGDDLEPGDIICTPPGEEHHLRFGAATSIASIMMTPADLQASFAGEPGMDDYTAWADRLRFRADAPITSEITRRVLAISALLETHGPDLSEAATEFWRRAILEAFSAAAIHASQPYRTHIPAPLKLVREVERYVDARPDMPIHISEICAAFRVSRRTLHRAFHDAIGMGPVAFLRRKRLCAVHTALINGDPSRTRVTDIAIEFGFSELGRFAGYYLNMFGETPSATLRKSGRGIHMRQRE
jgi:AraC-like DNA-binding protein